MLLVDSTSQAQGPEEQCTNRREVAGNELSNLPSECGLNINSGSTFLHFP